MWLQRARSVHVLWHPLAMGVGLAALTGLPAAWAEEARSSEQEDVTVEKTAERLHFKVPADWPVEKRGGVMAPIPIEEYLARKFKALEAQLQSIEQRVAGLDLRVRVLEEASKKQSKGLSSAESGGP